MTNTKPIRIASVDDKQVVQEGMKLFFQIFDDLELVATVNKSKEIFRVCKEQDIDIVLMDIVMPEMDGIMTTRLLTENFPDIAVIGLTSAYSDILQRQAILHAGAVDCLPKNASIKDIEAAIRKAIR